MEPLLGSIILFGGTIEPRGWAFGSGQSLHLAEESALPSLLGTSSGGDGLTIFRRRTCAGVSWSIQAPAQACRCSHSDILGHETVTLSPTQVPPHSHDLLVANVPGSSDRTGSTLRPNPLSIALT
jgi:microcystin-dependent protein